MEIIIFFPIGGFLCVVVVIAIIAIWDAVVNNQQIFLGFANEHTDLVLLITFAIIFITSIILVSRKILIDSNQKKGTLFKYTNSDVLIETLKFSPLCILCSLTATASAMATYCYFIDWAEDIMGFLADGIIMILVNLLISPLLLLLLLIVTVLCIAPNLINIILFDTDKNYFLLCIINSILIAVYSFILFRCGFTTVLINSFST